MGFADRLPMDHRRDVHVTHHAIQRLRERGGPQRFAARSDAELMNLLDESIADATKRGLAEDVIDDGSARRVVHLAGSPIDVDLYAIMARSDNGKQYVVKTLLPPEAIEMSRSSGKWMKRDKVTGEIVPYGLVTVGDEMKKAALVSVPVAPPVSAPPVSAPPPPVASDQPKSQPTTETPPTMPEDDKWISRPDACMALDLHPTRVSTLATIRRWKRRHATAGRNNREIVFYDRKAVEKEIARRQKLTGRKRGRKRESPQARASSSAIPQRVRALLAKFGCNQTDLSRRLDVSPGLVNMWLNGKTSPGPRLLAALENLESKTSKAAPPPPVQVQHPDMAARVKALKAHFGDSWAQLGKRIGVSHAAVEKYGSGRTFPAPAQLALIEKLEAKVFGAKVKAPTAVAQPSAAPAPTVAVEPPAVAQPSAAPAPTVAAGARVIRYVKPDGSVSYQECSEDAATAMYKALLASGVSAKSLSLYRLLRVESEVSVTLKIDG